MRTPAILYLRPAGMLEALLSPWRRLAVLGLPHSATAQEFLSPNCWQGRKRRYWAVVTGRIFSFCYRTRRFACFAAKPLISTSSKRLRSVSMSPSTSVARRARCSRRLHTIRPPGASSTPASIGLAAATRLRPHGVGSRRAARFLGAKFEEHPGLG